MEVITINQWPLSGFNDYRPDLEAGNIVFFPTTPFALSEVSKEFLRTLDFSGGAVHKNIAYRPVIDRVTGVDPKSVEMATLHDVFREYSRNLIQFARELLPEYAAAWKLDYASFRPLEERGRDLPVNKRNDLIHTDAFPSRPTQGDLILRVFTNIHPAASRVWITSDPFKTVAERYAQDAGLQSLAARSTSPAARLRDGFLRLLNRLHLPVFPRSPYDRFMLRFHDYLKRNEEFQSSTTKYRFEFPPGSTWLAFTDVLPHSVESGQYALEQTFIVARESLASRASTPVAILERLCGKPLVA
ncbi:MAG: Kdo hydroxylase family protein [Acidobacteriaceae bacterium]|nr:Kdo hydroxylase family protein [Acidobacteriaceae bacterium]